ncbi:MAG: tRNA preQ1(34) S-adenosylmethionine ribosyltransferase-isomerase QueA [Acetobacteraceae bacterium]|nr:tRNA preQ1(34) S-adenosylmethionine ribosyltransferase-isomerase QueA [Acetobacteraceae bacterium]MSP30053.1 tRNA preQ1(34) S-adenosylmethionine ribosyltransferase-isomerase QueA [Acetobacteraceae bacterium]
MKISDFDFFLPPERIAQHPAQPRDTAGLLHVTQTALEDRIICDLPHLLRPGDLIVANDTRVIPAQLTSRRGNATIGITLDQPNPDGTWHALARNTRRVQPGDILTITENFAAEVITKDPDGGVTLRFNLTGESFFVALRDVGELALPPYITRPSGPSARDAQNYQTIFAQREGAIAAPTAGLHFTPALLQDLQARQIDRATITLHVGAGTFLPMRTDNIKDHRMHAERGEISLPIAARINATRKNGGRIVAIGTTVVRLLESATTEDGVTHPFNDRTSIFITPGHRFRAVDAMVTNFHLPRSTLFMLVCAFMSTPHMHAAYAHAIAKNYRFFSYGDACLLDPA